MVNFVKRQDQPLFHLTSKIPMQKIVHMVISLIMIIIIFTIPIQYAQSSKGNTNIILFTQSGIREFTAGQTVHLEGTVVQAISQNPTGIANAHFQIIDASTGNIITEGNADNQGLFFMDWIASSPSPGISKVDLMARFAGGAGYDASDSLPLTLTISSPVSTTPSFVYHNTQLTVQVREGSSPGYVQINPVLRVDSGSPLTTSQVSISVDGSSVSTISSNQWSGDIFVDSGTHKIQGYVPQLTDNKDGTIIYRESRDSTTFTPVAVNTYYDTQLSVQVRDSSSPGYIQVEPLVTYSSSSLSTTVTLSIDGTFNSNIPSNQWSGDIFVGSGTHKIQGYVPQTRDSNNNSVFYKSTNYVIDYTISSQMSTLNNNPPPNNSPSITSQSSQSPNSTNNPPPSQDFTVLAIVVIAVIIAGTGIGIARIKRRQKTIKSSPMMGGSFGGTPVSTNPSHTDDTQFYGCPNCGRDTSIKYGKQYCENCRMYL